MFPQRLLHRSKENLKWTYSVDFIERFPLFVRHSKDLRGLDCPLHLARPHFKIFDVLLLEEIPQTFGKLDSKRAPQKDALDQLCDLKHMCCHIFSTCTDTDLFSSVRQARVSSDASFDVEVALTVATEVDGARCDVDVHQVVDNSALDVVNDTVHQVTTAHVHYLYVGQIPETRRSVNHLWAWTDFIHSTDGSHCERVGLS